MRRKEREESLLVLEFLTWTIRRKVQVNTNRGIGFLKLHITKKMNNCLVDKIMLLKDVHVLISRTCEYASKRVFPDVVRQGF